MIDWDAWSRLSANERREEIQKIEQRLLDRFRSMTPKAQQRFIKALERKFQHINLSGGLRNLA